MKYFQIQTMQVETTEKNEALTTKMQEHANLVQQKDELEQQLLEVRKELDAAYHTIANQVQSHLSAKWRSDLLDLSFPYRQAFLLSWYI
jgi:chromosome segregation ATPase